MIVIVPSNRSVNLDYLAPLIESGARFIVVDDTEGTIKVDHPAFRVVNWGDRRRILGDLDPLFPRRNGACRNFGFYLAWQEVDEDEIIVALDDDCEVEYEDFAARVEAALSPATRPLWSGEGRHANILELYEDVGPDLYPRGFPYTDRVHHEPWTFEGTTDGAPSFNLGLWRDAFDVNAADKIRGPEWRHPEARLKHPSVSVPEGAWISACSMNMQFRARVLPCVYQFPMHIPVMPNQVIDRYGDIWGGFLLKLLMDKRGDLMTVGDPMIGHRKAGDLQRNLWQEHITHMVNDEFIAILVGAGEEVRPGPYLEMLAHLREGIARRTEGSSPLLRPYLDHLVPALGAWVTALGRGRSATGATGREYVA